LYEYLGGEDLRWAYRVDFEAGYQHLSNGKSSLASRSTEYIYMKPTFVWRTFKDSWLFVSPKIWGYFRETIGKNKDIAEYWGYFDMEIIWRANCGLQIETHTRPASRAFTFTTSLSYPLNNLWKPINFYLWVDFQTGAGRSFLSYKEQSTSIAIGIFCFMIKIIFSIFKGDFIEKNSIITGTE
jgi:outer membrane phospholipase A